MVDSTPGSRVSDSPQANGSMRSLEELISNTDKYLTRAIKCHDVLQTDLEQLRSDYKEVCLLILTLTSTLMKLYRERMTWRKQELNCRTRSDNAN